MEIDNTLEDETNPQINTSTIHDIINKYPDFMKLLTEGQQRSCYQVFIKVMSNRSLSFSVCVVCARCGDPCLSGLVSTYPTPSHHHYSSLFPSQTILINLLSSNPCIHLFRSFNLPVGLPRKLHPVLVLCPCHLGFAGESFSTLLS